MRDRPLQVSGFKLQATATTAVAELAGTEPAGGLHEDECDETGGGQVFQRFVEAMRAAGPEKATMVEDALSAIGGEGRGAFSAALEGQEGRRLKKVGMWETIKAREESPQEGEAESSADAGGGATFSFGFGLGMEDEVGDDLSS